jgi:alpha-tubulin suppressor-like RCC1 family protein
MLHPDLNKNYDVEDLACGSNHTVIIAKDKGYPCEKHLITFGHKGSLGVNKYEDTHEF